MPLIKFFSRTALRFDVAAVHAQLCKSWAVPSDTATTPLQFVFSTHTETFPPRACLVDIRAKVKPERTPAFLDERMREIAEIVRGSQAGDDNMADVRVCIELFEPSLSCSKCFDMKLG